MAVRRIQTRRGTKDEWSAANPILAIGEPGFERDTGIVKFGNGADAWSVLRPVGSRPTAQSASDVPLITRGVAGQTGNLLEAQDSAGAVLAAISSTGGFRFENSGYVAAMGVRAERIPGSDFSVTAGAATNRPIIVRGADLQSANLAEFQNNAGSVMTVVRANGNVGIGSSSNTSALLVDSVGDNTVAIFARAVAATNIPLVVRGAVSQTGNLAEVQNSSGTALFSLTSVGRMNINSGSGNTATTATAGTRTLPANPVNFLVVQINGVDHKIPYYAV